MPDLNPKQKRFVAEYLIDANATQAAIRAGYSRKTATEQGSRLLTNVKVRAALDAKQAKIASKLEITAERVIAELALLGFSNMQDYLGVTADGTPFVDLSAVDRDKWAAVGEVTVDHINKRDGEETKTVERVKFKLADKRAALVDLGKHLHIFDETVNVNVNDVTPSSPLDDARRTAFHLEQARRLLLAGNGPSRANSTSNGEPAT